MDFVYDRHCILRKTIRDGNATYVIKLAYLLDKTYEFMNLKIHKLKL